MAFSGTLQWQLLPAQAEIERGFVLMTAQRINERKTSLMLTCDVLK